MWKSWMIRYGTYDANLSCHIYYGFAFFFLPTEYPEKSDFCKWNVSWSLLISIDCNFQSLSDKKDSVCRIHAQASRSLDERLRDLVVHVHVIIVNDSGHKM